LPVGHFELDGEQAFELICDEMFDPPQPFKQLRLVGLLHDNFENCIESVSSGVGEQEGDEEGSVVGEQVGEQICWHLFEGLKETSEHVLHGCRDVLVVLVGKQRLDHKLQKGIGGYSLGFGRGEVAIGQDALEDLAEGEAHIVGGCFL
jgi:hypothetical protein